MFNPEKIPPITPENKGEKEGKGPEAEETGSEEPKNQTAEDIKKCFESLAEGAKEGAKKKTEEYDRRIREIIAKDPNDPNLKGALEDFKQWTKQEWTDDFTTEKSPEETVPEKAEETGSEEPENNDFELTLEEIAKELNSRAMRVDETVEGYNRERKESLEKPEKVEQAQPEKDQEKIVENKEDSNEEMASYKDACERDLFDHLNSPDTNWASVEGRIAAMLAEIQEVERSDKTYEIIEKVSENIANWLKENAGKYDNNVLSSEAVKHAASQAEENFSKLEGKAQEAEETGSEDLEEPKDQTARDIKRGFEALAEGARRGFSEGVKKKIAEYDERIRAVIAGKPLKSYDKLEDLKKDFKQLTKIEWAEDFTSEKL